MVAGPNGAGKTTMQKELMYNTEHLDEFINADTIAAALAPLHPETMALTASKLLIKRMTDLIEQGKSFAFESTGAGKNFLKHLKYAKTCGYHIDLFFICLGSPDQAIARVKQRVLQKGHHIPTETIIRRFHLGLKNLKEHYLPLSDSAIIVTNAYDDPDNSLLEQKQANSSFHSELLSAHKCSFNRALKKAVSTDTVLVYLENDQVQEVCPPYSLSLMPLEQLKIEAPPPII